MYTDLASVFLKKLLSKDPEVRKTGKREAAIFFLAVFILLTACCLILFLRWSLR